MASQLPPAPILDSPAEIAPPGGFSDLEFEQPPNFDTTEKAEGLVASRFSTAQTYANSAWSQSVSFLNSIKNLSFPVSWTQPSIPDISNAKLDSITPSKPVQDNLSNVSIVIPTFSDADPDIGDVDISIGSPPAFSISDPIITIPDMPEVTFPSFDSLQPDIQMPEIPPAPDIEIPPVPTITDVAFPDTPEYTIADFSADIPSVDIEVPVVSFNWDESVPESEIGGIIEMVIRDTLASGGSALNAAAETAIWDRAIARQEDEIAKEQDTIESYFSSRGFRMPPGMMAGQLIELHDRALRTRTDINNDILVQQSKLADENMRFAVQQATEVLKLFYDYTGQMKQRALEAAKYSVEAANANMQAKVELLKAKLSIYSTEAQVYEIKIRAETAKADLYKSMIDATMGKVEIQKLYLEAHQAQLAAIDAMTKIYQSKVQAAQVTADAGRTTMQTYATAVDAFKARIDASKARYEAHAIQVDGEKAKADVYRSMVDAYASRINGYKAVADVEVSRARAVQEKTASEVSVYNAKIQKYMAIVDAKVKEADTKAKIEGLKVDSFDAKAKMYQAEIDAVVKAFAAAVEEAKGKYDMSLAAADIAVKTALAKHQMVGTANDAASRVMAQMVGSALNAVSASASINASGSQSASVSYGVSNSVAKSLSFNNSASISNANSSSFSNANSSSNSNSGTSSDSTSVSENHNYYHEG